MAETPTLRRLLVTGGAGFIGSCYVRDVLGAARRHADHGPRQADLRGQRGEPRAGPRRPGDGRPVRIRARRHRRSGRSSSRSWRQPTRSSTSPPSRTSTARSSIPRRSCATGVIGVHVLLEACRTAPDRPRFLQVSTDEVYGSVDEGHAAEDAPLAPRSPYAAAKAAGELLVRSYVVTHGVDAVVTRGSNTYGPYHHPEKLIPLFITNAIDDRPLPLYGDGLQRRDWLYVADHAAAIDFVLRHGERRRDVQRRGRRRADEPRGRGACSWSGSASRGRWSGRSRTGRATTGATRWTARSWRPSAGAARRRSRTAWRRRWTGTGPTRPGGGPPRSGDWDGWYERQYGARALATGRPPRRRRRRRGHAARLMRVAVTGAGGRLGSALVAALADAPVHRPGRADRAGPRAAFDLDAPDGDRRAASSATGRRSSSMPRPGPTSTAAPSTPSGPSGGTAAATGVLAAACADRGIDLLAVSTNEVFDGERTRRHGTVPTDRPRPATRTGRRRPRASGSRRRRSPKRPALLRHRPDSVAVRGAGARLSQPDPRCRRACAGSRRTAPRRGRRVGDPDLHRRCRGCDRRTAGEDAMAGVHHLVNGLTATRADWARDVVARAARGRGRERPDVDLGAAVDPASLGSPGGDTASRPVSRSASGPMPWPTTRRVLLRAARARA